MTHDEFLSLYDRKQNVTYKMYLEYNAWCKKTFIRPKKVRILRVDYELNMITYYVDNATYMVYIDKFLNSLQSYNMYVTNPSLLKSWKGFYTDKYIYLLDSIIKCVNNLIPDTFNGRYRSTLNFEIIDRKELKSYILRNKLSYVCKQIEEHFWFVKKGYNVTIFSDIPIYTPIDSELLFAYTKFWHIDLHNVNLEHTKYFTKTFYKSKCVSIDFGDKVNTYDLISMESMFQNSNIEKVDMRKFNLSNVQTIKNFAADSEMIELYLNTNTKSLEQVYYALYRLHTGLKSNILDIDMTNVIDKGYIFS